MGWSNLAGLLLVAAGLLLVTTLDLPADLAWWLRLTMCVAGLSFLVSIAIGAFIDWREGRE